MWGRKFPPAEGKDSRPSAGHVAVKRTRAPTDLLAWKQRHGVHQRACRSRDLGPAPPATHRDTRAESVARRCAGMALPDIELRVADGARECSLRDLALDWLVVYFYPGGQRTLDDASCLEDAREHRAYRNARGAFNRRGARVASVCAEPAQLQLASMFRHDLRHHMLCDPTLAIAHALALPTESVSELARYKRLTLIARAGLIRHVFYPVVQAERSPTQVLTWLDLHDGETIVNVG